LWLRPTRRANARHNRVQTAVSVTHQLPEWQVTGWLMVRAFRTRFQTVPLSKANIHGTPRHFETVFQPFNAVLHNGVSKSATTHFDSGHANQSRTCTMQNVGGTKPTRRTTFFPGNFRAPRPRPQTIDVQCVKTTDFAG
jgi:hypothetical protein